MEINLATISIYALCMYVQYVCMYVYVYIHICITLEQMGQMSQVCMYVCMYIKYVCMYVQYMYKCMYVNV